MRAWIKDALSQVKTKDRLQSILHELSDPYGEVVTTDVSCCDAVEPREVTCKIRMAGRPAADSLANWLGTTTQGNDIVVLKYQAPSGFMC